jgi:hypothetical protein
VGHQRVGVLPRTTHWRALVHKLATPHLSEDAVADIARDTLALVRSRFRAIENDTGVQAAFSFLVAVAVSQRREDQHNVRRLEVSLPEEWSPLGIVRAARDHVAKRASSLEYAEIAKQALGDAVVAWHTGQRSQPDLFVSSEDSAVVWGRASTGAGFSELARLFFARFTERYLKYFLERAASNRARSIKERDQLSESIGAYLDRISRHAFETSRITQSFAAGWFNARVEHLDSFDAGEVRRFLAIAFGKLRDELYRESETT